MEQEPLPAKRLKVKCEPVENLDKFFANEIVNDCFSFQMKEELQKVSNGSSSKDDINLNADQCVYEFQANVLLRLQNIEEMQQEIMNTLRHLASSHPTPCVATTDDLDDLFPKPAESVDEVDALCLKLSTDKSFKKRVMSVFTSLGGCDVSDTTRRILRKVGSHGLWSLYSFKGRKAKMSFQDLSLSPVTIRCCLINHPSATVSSVENCISEFLKHAPKSKGGLKYKEPIAASRESTYLTDLLDSDSNSSTVCPEG